MDFGRPNAENGQKWPMAVYAAYIEVRRIKQQLLQFSKMQSQTTKFSLSCIKVTTLLKLNRVTCVFPQPMPCDNNCQTQYAL